jgi:hypothetical protein
MIIKLATFKQAIRPLMRNKGIVGLHILNGTVIGASIGNNSNKEKHLYGFKRNKNGSFYRKPETNTGKRILTGAIIGAFGGLGTGAFTAKSMDGSTKMYRDYARQFKQQFKSGYHTPPPRKPKTATTDDIKSFFKTHANITHTNIKTKKEATNHYRNAARIHHPDAGGKVENFQKLETDWSKVKTSPWFEKLAAIINRTRNNSIEHDIAQIQYGGYSISGNGNINVMNPRRKFNRLMSPFHSVFDNSQAVKDGHKIGVLHELSERKYFKQLEKDKNINPRSFVGAQIQRKFMGTPTGAHVSLAVLGEESNNLNRITSEKVKERVKKMRYMTGENDLLKNITGKTYGKHIFTPEDLEKLHNTSTKAKSPFKVGSKSLIGGVAGAVLAPMLVKKKYKAEDVQGKRIGAAILGGVAGASAEKFIRTNILKLHK